MTTGELLVRGTIWSALAACVVRWAIGLSSRGEDQRRSRIVRRLWTFGCVMLWVHVTSAFGVYHRWSHQAAYDQTARQTAAVTGLGFGAGIWFNYLVMALWAGDVLWWWLAPKSFERRAVAIDWCWQGFLAFIAFNSTVVFAQGAIRWMGLAVTAILVVLAYRRACRGALCGKHQI